MPTTTPRLPSSQRPRRTHPGLHWDRARVAAEAAAQFNAEAYRKLHAGNDDAWMPLDNLTDVTEALSELWRDLAEAFEI